MSDYGQVSIYINGKRESIQSVDTRNYVATIDRSGEWNFIVVMYKPPVRITWIRPRYGLRRPKLGAN